MSKLPDEKSTEGKPSTMPARVAWQGEPSRRFSSTPALFSADGMAPYVLNVGRRHEALSHASAVELFSDEPPGGDDIFMMSPGGISTLGDESTRVGFRPSSQSKHRSSTILDYLRSEPGGTDAFDPDAMAAAGDVEVDEYSPNQASQAHLTMLSTNKLTPTNIKGLYITKLPQFTNVFRAIKVLTLITRKRLRPKMVVRSRENGSIIDSPERWDIDKENAWCITLVGIDTDAFATEIDLFSVNYDVCGLWDKLSELHQKQDDQAQLELFERINDWNFIDPTLDNFSNIIGPWLVLISLFRKITLRPFAVDHMWLLFRKLCTRNPHPHPAYQRFSDEYPRHAESFWRVNSQDTYALIERFIAFDSVRPPYRGALLPPLRDSAVMFSSTLTEQQVAALRRDKKCLEFARTGKCRFGANCQYSHDIATASAGDSPKLTPQEATILNRRAAAGHTGGQSSKPRGPPHLIEAGTFVAKEHRDVLAALNLRTEPHGKPGFWSKRQSDVLAALMLNNSPAEGATQPPTTSTYSPQASAYLIPVSSSPQQARVPAWGPPANSPWYANLVNPPGGPSKSPMLTTGR